MRYYVVCEDKDGIEVAGWPTEEMGPELMNAAVQDILESMPNVDEVVLHPIH